MGLINDTKTDQTKKFLETIEEVGPLGFRILKALSSNSKHALTCNFTNIKKGSQLRSLWNRGCLNWLQKRFPAQLNMKIQQVLVLVLA